MEKYWLFYESQICFREAIERICNFTMKGEITHVSSVHKNDAKRITSSVANAFTLESSRGIHICGQPR